MAAPVRDGEWPARTAKLQERFCCLLDEQPTHLVPERLLRQLQRSFGERELCFNPDCRLLEKGQYPDALLGLGEPSDASSGADFTIAYVEDPATTAGSVYWLNSALRETLHDVRQNPRNIPKFAADVHARLCGARILVREEYAQTQRGIWSGTVERCRARFGLSGYAPITGLIHPFQLAELRRYYRRKIRKGDFLLGDEQSSRRYVAHNEPAARFFHLQLTKAVGDLVGEAVKPSYVYMASYQGGARLERHTDRAQCEFTITLCVDSSPDPTGASRWPLHLDTGVGTVTVYQGLGDALLYRGRELPHYRGTLAAGNTSTSIFFHYVGADFPGPLE